MPRPELAMIAGGRFPDPLVEGARSVLRQYGYRHLEEGRSRDDWAEMWPLLRSDFAQGAGPAVPQYDALPVAIGEAAREYMRRRLIADHLLDACQEAHAALFRDGIDSARVEAYSAAREAYEHSVEDFGAAGEIVEGLLHGHAAG